jgi:hypothetical protein
VTLVTLETSSSIECLELAASNPSSARTSGGSERHGPLRPRISASFRKAGAWRVSLASSPVDSSHSPLMTSSLPNKPPSTEFLVGGVGGDARGRRGRQPRPGCSTRTASRASSSVRFLDATLDAPPCGGAFSGSPTAPQTRTGSRVCRWPGGLTCRGAPGSGNWLSASRVGTTRSLRSASETKRLHLSTK